MMNFESARLLFSQVFSSEIRNRRTPAAQLLSQLVLRIRVVTEERPTYPTSDEHALLIPAITMITIPATNSVNSHFIQELLKLTI